MDEDADYSEINFEGCSDITFDFNAISLINSCGIRDWKNKIEELDTEHVTINWMNCHKEIISQVNMIDKFIPQGAKIKSLFVPYFCDSCEEQSELFFELSDKMDIPETTTCLFCQKEAEIDVIESDFFKFLKIPN
jgi:hypothetical protein